MSIRFLDKADSVSRRALQKKGVLSEAALPEELRLALAQNMQNDLFYQVRVCEGEAGLGGSEVKGCCKGPIDGGKVTIKSFHLLLGLTGKTADLRWDAFQSVWQLWGLRLPRCDIGHEYLNRQWWYYQLNSNERQAWKHA
jgi:hypothetical protein